MKDITKNMTIAEVLDAREDAEEILGSFGMHCFHCPMSRMETIEEAAEAHGVEADDILAKLNK